MSQPTIIHYKTLSRGVIRIDSNGVCTSDRGPLMKRGYTLNRWAVFYDDSITRLIEDRQNLFCAPNAVFISPQCSISRDIVRTCYSIVRSPEKADVTIIPDARDFSSLQCNIAIFLEDKEELILYHIMHRGSFTSSDADDKRHAVAYLQEAFQNSGMQFFFNYGEENTNVVLLPQCQEYEDVLMQTYPHRDYLMESNLPINRHAIDINLETLEIWSRMSDRQLLEKSLVNSNWQDYPFTLTMFFRLNGNIDIYYSYNKEVRRVLRDIGYYELVDYRSWGVRNSNLMITPEDYAMWQSYAFQKLGVSPEGGYVKKEKLQDVFSKTLRNRVAVAKKVLTAPVTYSDLRREVENT